MKGGDHTTGEIQIGGQAVIEGVAMRGPERWAVAVRRSSGEIVVVENPTRTLAERYPRYNHFPVRGIFALVDSLIIGVKSLSISGGISLEDAADAGDEGATGDNGPLEPEPAAKKEEKTMANTAVVIALVVALAIFLGLFIVVPAVVARMLDRYLVNTVVYNLFEGFLRIAVFLLYLVGISFIPEIRRVFEYHGAEHKVVHAYEAGLQLNPDTAGWFSTIHMRCGTTFIIIVFVISVLVFSLLGRPSLVLRILYRIAVIPLVAAVSYEIIKFAGRKESSPVVRFLMAPGLWFQKITTREPDRDQLVVAIDALEAAVGNGAPAPGERS